MRLFIDDPDSVAFGVAYLRTIAWFYPFIGLNFIFNGVVRGSGAMLQVLVLNIISLWILRVPGLVAGGRLGEHGIALGIGISFLLSSLFSYGYYRWGGWRTSGCSAKRDPARPLTPARRHGALSRASRLRYQARVAGRGPAPGTGATR